MDESTAPHDDKKLAELLANFPERNINDVFYDLYEKRVQDATRDFLKIFHAQDLQ